MEQNALLLCIRHGVRTLRQGRTGPARSSFKEITLCQDGLAPKWLRIEMMLMMMMMMIIMMMMMLMMMMVDDDDVDDDDG